MPKYAAYPLQTHAGIWKVLFTLESKQRVCLNSENKRKRSRKVPFGGKNTTKVQFWIPMSKNKTKDDNIHSMVPIDWRKCGIVPYKDAHANPG